MIHFNRLGVDPFVCPTILLSAIALLPIVLSTPASALEASENETLPPNDSFNKTKSISTDASQPSTPPSYRAQDLMPDPQPNSQPEEQVQLTDINDGKGNSDDGNSNDGNSNDENINTRTDNVSPYGFYQVSIDNHFPPDLGGIRVNAEVGRINNLVSGDELTGYYSRSTAGRFEEWELAYSFPVNPPVNLPGNETDGRVTLQFSSSDGRGEFEGYEYEGNVDTYTVSYRQPILSSEDEELALSIAVEHQQEETFIDGSPYPFVLGPEADGTSRTSIIRLGQEYSHFASNGSWVLASTVSLGTGLFNATQNDGEVADGQFFSWLGEVERRQFVGDRHELILSGAIQLSPDALLPNQKFALGGQGNYGERNAQGGVRGYRDYIRYGDNGAQLTLADEITLDWTPEGEPRVQLIPFVDMGTVWNSGGNPDQLPTQNFLASTGLELNWNEAFGVDALNLALDYAIPLVDISDSDYDLGGNRLYFRLSYGY